jgi:hypothetical protein
MTALWKRFTGLIPPYAKSPTRLSLLGVVACVAAIIILEMDKEATVSTHSLSVALATVLAIGCLIYTPPRLLGTLAIVAVGGLVCYAFKGNLLLLVLAILVGLCWLTVGIAQVNELLLKRLDCLQEKLEEIESKQGGLH